MMAYAFSSIYNYRVLYIKQLGMSKQTLQANRNFDIIFLQ